MKTTLIALCALLGLSTSAAAQLTFGPRVLVGTVTPENGLLAVDYDADGDRDLITMVVRLGLEYDVVLLERTAGGGLLAPVVIGTGVTGTTVAAILMDDLDGDSQLDLVVANADRNLRLHRGLPGGMLGSPEVLLFGNNRISALAATDVDQDGDLDLAFVEEFSNQVLLLRQGPLGFTQEVLATGISVSRDLQVHDLDGDGDQDIVGLWYEQDSVFMMLADQGTLGPPVVIASGVEEPERLAVADMVGDAGLDVVVTGGFDNRLWRIENVQQASSWNQVVIDPAAEFPFNIEIGDISDDGILDIIVTPTVGSGPTLYLSDGQGGYTQQHVTLGPFNARMNFVLDDFDQDGDVDIVIWSAFDETDLYQVEQTTPIGTPFCPGSPNSTGGVATVTAAGSQQVALDDLRLSAAGLPANTFGLFVTSRDIRSPFVPAGGAGAICLGDASGAGIGRLDGPGQVLDSGPSGRFALSPDLSALPTNLGSTAAMVGETWHFQAWFRDQVGGMATFNFSEGLGVLLR